MPRLAPLFLIRPSISLRWQSYISSATLSEASSSRPPAEAIRNALSVSRIKKDWVTAEEIWRRYILGKNVSFVDADILEAVVGIALEAKDVRGAFSAFSAARRLVPGGPSPSTYRDLIAGLLDSTKDTERIGAAIQLLEEMKGTGDVGDPMVHLMLEVRETLSRQLARFSSHHLFHRHMELPTI